MYLLMKDTDQLQKHILLNQKYQKNVSIKSNKWLLAQNQRSQSCTRNLGKTGSQVVDNSFDTNKIYKSKIACIPTPGYAGHTSIFIKPISYLHKEKHEECKTVENFDSGLGLSEGFRNVISQPEESEVL
jgi:hypothetical protein